LSMGVTMFISFIIENTHCRSSWMTILPSLLFWGSVAGAGGSLVGFKLSQLCLVLMRQH
jgi:hypothetical protein